MKSSNQSDEYSADEAARRRDAVVRRMIATPPTPHAPAKGKRKPSRSKPATAKSKK